MKTIVIATKNKGKIKEMIKEFADLPVNVRALTELGNLPDAIENGNSFAENALLKAKFYAEKTGTACIADDSGLEIDELDKRPGIYSARFAGEPSNDMANNKKMLSELNRKNVKESSARYKCVLVFYDIDGTKLQAEGICEGKIRLLKKGNNGFGYDPYFFIGDKSMAELSIEEKNKISHRGKAIRKIKQLLSGYLL
ncbi:RdgB/HAM1 family non-canonical purine NTP pyrophosphatase [Pectinatus sottacetonis]|uniref:RdgB/HAM1 family non-canonical purine NTP pyrophosphatase n=1 Tax=Pectinatus sottacetonis TaxID=1002795 RepID=UPI0018C7A7CC|nr:RdgB/HAM1 family non-canonical purine NTP pyrophosphatase [Pectinatus sottacetonis]